jgi:hypothetical protein
MLPKSALKFSKPNTATESNPEALSPPSSHNFRSPKPHPIRRSEMHNPSSQTPPDPLLPPRAHSTSYKSNHRIAYHHSIPPVLSPTSDHPPLRRSHISRVPRSPSYFSDPAPSSKSNEHAEIGYRGGVNGYEIGFGALGRQFPRPGSGKWDVRGNEMRW